MPFPFAFAWLNAIQAVRHSHIFWSRATGKMPIGACILPFCWLGLSPKACVALFGNCTIHCFVSLFGPWLTESIVERQSFTSLVLLPVFLGFASSIGPGLTESVVERQHFPPTLVSLVCLSLIICATSTK